MCPPPLACSQGAPVHSHQESEPQHVGGDQLDTRKQLLSALLSPPAILQPKWGGGPAGTNPSRKHRAQGSRAGG